MLSEFKVKVSNEKGLFVAFKKLIGIVFPENFTLPVVPDGIVNNKSEVV